MTGPEGCPAGPLEGLIVPRFDSATLFKKRLEFRAVVNQEIQCGEGPCRNPDRLRRGGNLNLDDGRIVNRLVLFIFEGTRLYKADFGVKNREFLVSGF